MLGLIVFGSIAIWAVITCLMLFYLFRRIWRGDREKQGTGWRIKTAVYGLFVLVWLAGFFWYGGGQIFYYDAEVNRLCAIDGGVKVYETVELPAEKFNQWGQVNFVRYTQGEDALGSEYIYKSETIYFRKTNPRLYRSHYEVIRRADGKRLGETTLYLRGGGDFLGSLSASSYDCPPINEASNEALLKQIFIPSTQ